MIEDSSGGAALWGTIWVVVNCDRWWDASSDEALEDTRSQVYVGPDKL